MFLFGDAAITWKSSKQTCVALSTAEAEYVALATAAQEAVWLQQLMNDLMNKNIQEILIFEDNQSTICLAKNQQAHGRTKHIDIKYHFVRDLSCCGVSKTSLCQLSIAIFCSAAFNIRYSSTMSMHFVLLFGNESCKDIVQLAIFTATRHQSLLWCTGNITTFL